MIPPRWRLLVADDDSALAEVIRRSLHRAGIDDVVIVGDGIAALQQVQSQAFDLIVTDYRMPRLNGEELCRMIRQDSLNKATPVIFCSAKGYELSVDQLRRELQISEFFIKPFSPRELVAAVQNTLAANATSNE